MNPSTEEIEAYWQPHEFKKWVVIFSTGLNKKAQRETLYVRARDKAGALATAKRHCTLPKIIGWSIWLAGPQDLTT